MTTQLQRIVNVGRLLPDDCPPAGTLVALCDGSGELRIVNRFRVDGRWKAPYCRPGRWHSTIAKHAPAAAGA